MASAVKMAHRHATPENTTYKLMSQFVAAGIEDRLTDPRNVFKAIEKRCGFGEEMLNVAIAAVDALAAKFASGDPTLHTKRGYGEAVTLHAMDGVAAYAPAYLACITNSIIRERKIDTKSHRGFLTYCRIANLLTKCRTYAFTIARALQYVNKSGYKILFTDADLEYFCSQFSKDASKREASDSETSDSESTREVSGARVAHAKRIADEVPDTQKIVLRVPDPAPQKRVLHAPNSPDVSAPDAASEVMKAAPELHHVATVEDLERELFAPDIPPALGIICADDREVNNPGSLALQLRNLLVGIRNCPYTISADSAVGVKLESCCKFGKYVAMPITEDFITVMWKGVREQFVPAVITRDIVPGVYYIVKQEYVHCMGNIVSITHSEKWTIVVV